MQEKRKLEEIISGKLNSAKSAFKNRRDKEYRGLRAQIEVNPPATVGKLVERYTAEIARNKEAVRTINNQATALGYCLDVGYRENVPTASLVKSSELDTHEEETTKRIDKLSELSDRYTLAVWAETEDMSKLFEKFNNEIVKLTS